MLGLLSNVGVGFALSDQDFRIVAADQAYAAILRRPRSEVVGLTMIEITHPDDIALNRWLLAVGGPFDLRKRYVRGDGAAQWVENRVCPLELGPGQRMYIVASRPIEAPTLDRSQGADRGYGPYLHDMAGQFARIASDAGLAQAAELMGLAANLIADEIGLETGGRRG